MQLFDTHAHIQGPEFETDIDAVIQAAAEAGLAGIVVPSEDVASAEAAIALSRRYRGVYAAAGVHPHEAQHFDDNARSRLRELLASPEVVAVGECGLDYYYENSPRETQKAVFEEMLRLSEESGKPLVIHVRDAWEDMAGILQPWAREMAGCKAGEPLGVLHYFSGTLTDAETYYDLGFLISIHTSVTHPKKQDLRDVVAALPLESMVIETDSPYGAPQAVRGKKNQPSFVREAAATIATMRGVEIEEVAHATTANAYRLFGLKPAAEPTLVGAIV